MARFDVYRHPDARRRKANPFFVSIQSDALDFLGTRVVIPLVDERSFGPRIEFLHPVLEIESKSVVLATNELVAVEHAALGNPIGTARNDAPAIVAAIDYLVSGY